MHLLEVLALLSLAFWVLLALDRERRWPCELFLPEGGEGEDLLESREVAAIVPARDEAEMVPVTLPALFGQSAKLRVVLVDDGSTDGTGAAAQAIAGREGAADRLRVIRAGAREEGWSGKVRALALGVEAVESGDAPDWPPLRRRRRELAPQALVATRTARGAGRR